MWARARSASSCSPAILDLTWSVSATTRDPRPGEVDGVDYRFLSRDEFVALRDAGGFLEWFEVYGQLKGTPREPVEASLRTGADVLLEVDVQGAMAVREQIPDALLVFVRAPSREAQVERLVGRDADDEEQMARRIVEAEAEEALADQFDAVVVNDDVDAAVDRGRCYPGGSPPRSGSGSRRDCVTGERSEICSGTH